MKDMHLFSTWTAMVLVTGLSQLHAQNFSSGSDGSFGAINITENTSIPLPPDGIINATTVNVADGTSLTFTKNSLNTPVFLLATGDVVVEGTINLNGQAGSTVASGAGGPGGFDGGSPASVGNAAGDGGGPGGGGAGTANGQTTGAGSGSYATAGNSGSSAQKGRTYGNAILIPIVGGSGGGGTSGSPGNAGGGGGGAFLCASTTGITIGSTGKIVARGGATLNNTFLNSGSGGAIRLIAPVVRGNGELDVRSSSSGGNPNSTFGGMGRIRIDTLDRTEVGFTFRDNNITSIGSNLIVFPSPLPSLSLTDVAGTSVTEGTQNSVFVNLPFGTDPNQTITVRARDFNAIIPIEIVLQPESGSRIILEDTIDNIANNPADKVINVTFPTNVATSVNVWTRPPANP